MKIGMLGGTFNPVHTGHLVLAQECWHKLSLDKVVFIPAHIQPLKDVREEDASPADRLNMVRLALEGDDRFEISTFEIDKGGESFSIDTVRHFREEYGPDAELFFITGSDSAETLSVWKDVDEILSLTTFVIAARPGWGEKSVYEDRVLRLVIPQLEISSSTIRERIAKREPVDFLVPAKVVQYVRNKGLYR